MWLCERPVELATHRLCGVVIARSVLSPYSSPTSVGWQVASLATHTTPRGACLPASLSLSPFVTDSLRLKPYTSTSAPRDGGRVSKSAALALAATSCAVREEAARGQAPIFDAGARFVTVTKTDVHIHAVLFCH
eukprot:682258-Pleurochrysis_carterae.AAC.2